MTAGFGSLSGFFAAEDIFAGNDAGLRACEELVVASASLVDGGKAWSQHVRRYYRYSFVAVVSHFSGCTCQSGQVCGRLKKLSICFCRESWVAEPTPLVRCRLCKWSRLLTARILTELFR